MACELMANAFRRSRYRLSCVGCAVDSVGVHAMLKEAQPDVAIISAHLKDGPVAGFGLTREIRASHPMTSVIMLLDSCTRPIVIEAFRAGAHGILSRDEPCEVLCKCIHTVYQGQVWANSNQLQFLIEALAETSPVYILSPKSVRGTNSLTEREKRVVQLVTEGLTNRDISRQLNLSEHTVRNYLFRIFNKVGTSNRLELALYALNQGADQMRPANVSQIWTKRAQSK